MRKRANQQVDKNAVAMIRTDFQCKEEMVGHVQ